MSIVSDFAAAMHTQAAAMIGAETVTVGADSISCVLAEANDAREFSEGGFEPARTLTAVCLTSALPAASILQKSATARSVSYRVVGVSKGGTFTTLTLEEVTRA